MGVISHYDWRWWGKSVIEAAIKGQRDLRLALEKVKSQQTEISDRKLTTKETQFLVDDGVLRFQKPRLSQIDKYLKKGIPVILVVRGEDLYHDSKQNYSHAILAVGKKRQHIFD